MVRRGRVINKTYEKRIKSGKREKGRGGWIEAG